jgi:hypothetical protein
MIGSRPFLPHSKYTNISFAKSKRLIRLTLFSEKTE